MTPPPPPEQPTGVVERARTAPDVVDLRAGDVTTAAVAPVAPVAPGTPEHVWYVSYGSNLLRRRFEVYLLGGRVPGLARHYPGGEGTSPATAERAVVLPGRLRFALDAPSWGGGGVAFWDPTTPGPGVLARAWRIRLGQFLEVVHLENGGLERRSAPWPVEVLTSGEASVGPGWYSRLLRPGQLDGEPALTFTHRETRSLATRAPSAAYAGVVAAGVVETFSSAGRGSVGELDARRYLAAALAPARPPAHSVRQVP